MSRKLKHTPNSRIKSALRNLWMKSRERAAVLKENGYTCQVCGAKQSRAKGKETKVEVHHCEGIVWERMYKAIRDDLLNQAQITLCVGCHDDKTKGE